MFGKFEIQIDSELEKFQLHLSQNSRVILSARFGDGKSYFLKKFKEKYNENFFFLTIYPVNYSVATNEDIFEYIKRDILVQLTQEGYKFDTADWKIFFESILTLDNAFDVIDLLTRSCQPLSYGIKRLIKTAKRYTEKSKNVDKYLASFKNTKGCIYENDVYTQTIQRIVERINPEKESVLIIEDLDRLDPAHLFRILNVLGAHIDQSSDVSTNKFGFLHIISVMDYDATEHIFHHFYGEEANFDGYMRKFYTDLPYRFSIEEQAHYALYGKIRDSLLSFNYISAVNIENPMLKKKFSMLSTRDVKRIYEMEPEKEYKVQNISIPPENIQLSIRLPIFRLYVYFHKLGCNADEFCQIVQKLFEHNEYDAVNLLLPLCVYDSYSTRIVIIRPDKVSCLRAKYTKENNVITECYTEQLSSIPNNVINKYDMPNVWETFCRTIKNIHYRYIIDSTKDRETKTE